MMRMKTGWKSKVKREKGKSEEEKDELLPFAFCLFTYQQRAAAIYRLYQGQYPLRFKWIRANLFRSELQQHLQQDATALMGILQLAGTWNPASDAKLRVLAALLRQQHPTDKVLIFTQLC